MAAIIILGMHRSGTSCLAGSLEQAGLYLGDVVQQAPHNKKGNRESLAIRDLNDRLLEANGAAWNKPPAALDWSDDLVRERDALIEGFAGQNVWGFKDPRTVLTLPFWLDGIADVRFAATFRHPIAVAKSLKARDGIERSQAFDLWAAYNERLLTYHTDFGFPLISFDLPVADYRKQLAQLCRALGLDPGPDGNRLDFFEKTLVNQSTTDELESMPDALAQLYARLVNVMEASGGPNGEA